MAFDAAYAYWCYNKTHGAVRPGIINPGGGNPGHGAETRLLGPAAQAVIDTNGLMVPHTYFGATPAPGVTEAWMMDAQVQYDYHLRPVLSWLPTFEQMGIDTSRIRFLFGEMGACAVNIDAEGKPGGYKDAAGGWRRHDSLQGDLGRYINLLVMQENLYKQYPQIEGGTIFTSGFVKWIEWQFNEEFNPLLDKLL